LALRRDGGRKGNGSNPIHRTTYLLRDADVRGRPEGRRARRDLLLALDRRRGRRAKEEVAGSVIWIGCASWISGMTDEKRLGGGSGAGAGDGALSLRRTVDLPLAVRRRREDARLGRADGSDGGRVRTVARVRGMAL
jgi:hypothetical protein